MCYELFIIVFFKQKTAYEMRISDWSSDVCSSDLSTKVDGWLRKLHVAAVGDTVRAGQALYELYSPDLVQRQREYIELLRRGDQLREAIGMPTGQTAQMLASLARERLRHRQLFENDDMDRAFMERSEKHQSE